MNTRYIKTRFITVRLLNGSNATAYIGEYALRNGTPQARCMVNGTFVQLAWNGTRWIEVLP